MTTGRLSPFQLKQLADYSGVVADEVLDEIYEKVAKLGDARMVHVNATSQGGGVAEMLEAVGIPVFILARRSFYDLPAFRRLVKLIREKQVDIVHTHLFSSHLTAEEYAV